MSVDTAPQSLAFAPSLREAAAVLPPQGLHDFLDVSGQEHRGGRPMARRAPAAAISLSLLLACLLGLAVSSPWVCRFECRRPRVSGPRGGVSYAAAP